MITRDALYDFIGDLITAAGQGTPLEDAVLFRSLRGPVDDAKKVIRVECSTGSHALTTEDRRKELGVKFNIQCWVMPDNDGALTDIENAVDLSFDMSRAIFEAIASDTSLGNAVCDCYADEFETGEANLGAAVRGCTYLDGTINEAN